MEETCQPQEERITDDYIREETSQSLEECKKPIEGLRPQGQQPDKKTCRKKRSENGSN